jgi:hypothetical protein
MLGQTHGEPPDGTHGKRKKLTHQNGGHNKKMGDMIPISHFFSPGDQGLYQGKK